MRTLLIALLVISIVSEGYACCCSRLNGEKGCERFDDWNQCIQHPCDWLGTLKPPCEDSCWEHRMKEQEKKMKRYHNHSLMTLTTNTQGEATKKSI